MRNPALSGVEQEQPLSSPARERLSLDQGWRFHLGDIPFPVIKGHEPSYFNAKAGTAWGAAAPDFDDTMWRELDLPHDWAVEGEFDSNENLAQGYRPRGIAWYRRHFHLPTADQGRHLELQFDGLATHCTVWVNGLLVHRNWCGYTSFYIDVTPFLLQGEAVNTIAIRVDASVMEGWWYEGAGIYRHVWLAKRNPVHIITDGVYAHPVRNVDHSWTLPIEVSLENFGDNAATVEVETTLLDTKGQTIGQVQKSATIPVLGQTQAHLELTVTTPQLWSVDNPALYHVRTKVRQEGTTIDEVTTTCGFRTVRFDANEGFFLNDQPLKLKGVCNHQDHAGVGVAVPDSLWDFRILRLKEMGVNAYRCAHNPPAAEFLDACDRLGILVMDENRHFNSTPEYIRQLEWLIQRDRNHPSVILWSVFNEEPMQGTAVGYEMVRRMAAIVRRLDPARPVTAAMNGGLFSPKNVSQAVDVVGFNYQHAMYDRFHEANPLAPLTSSEDTSAFMTRGEYTTDAGANVMDSYDTQRAPWGLTHREGWQVVADRPFLAGGFVWTGFDYRGEPTPLKWPSVSSFFGILDVCGFPKAAFYLHQAQWIEDRPIVHLIPHWNWEGSEGQPIKVMAFTNADTVALYLNGEFLSEETAEQFTTTWQVPYTSGRLEAVAKKAGEEVARTFVETTGPAVALQLVPDRSTLKGDGWDTQPITAQVVDARGEVIPTAKIPVEFSLSGGGELIGLGNGDPNSHEPDKGTSRSIFNGLAQAIVRSRAGATEPIVLTASAEGLLAASLEIALLPTPSPAAVEKQKPLFSLQKWRMSPISAERPNLDHRVNDNDMNTWTPIEPGELQVLPDGAWTVFRILFLPFQDTQENGGMLTFSDLAGKAEIWVEGKLLGEKETYESAALSVPLSPTKEPRILSVVIQSLPGLPVGIGGVVTIAATAP